MSPVERLPPARPTPGGPLEPYLPRGDLPAPERSPGSDRGTGFASAGEPDADAEPPFATLPDISERDLQADTLAFERVGRRDPRNWTWLKLTLALAVIGGSGVGAWRLWGEDLLRPAGDEIPVVRAPDGPFKLRPETPGGAEIRDRDKQVYGLLEPNKTPPDRPETLRPRPEAPLPPPVAAQPMTPEAAAAASDEGSPQMDIEPGSEEEEDETAITAVAPVAPASPPPPAPATKAPSLAQVKAAERPAPPPPPPAVKADDAAAAAMSSRAFKIQLGAVRSEAGARAEWTRLRKLNEPVLGRLTLNVERADLGAKGVFYRIQAGPFADRAAADAACAELVKNKVPCLPIRPES